MRGMLASMCIVLVLSIGICVFAKEYQFRVLDDLENDCESAIDHIMRADSAGAMDMVGVMDDIMDDSSR